MSVKRSLTSNFLERVILMKKSTRVLSIVLAMLMLFSMFTVAGTAANVDVANTSASVTSDGTARLYFNMSAVQTPKLFDFRFKIFT